MHHLITDSYLHQDHLGNIIAMTDKTGAITQRRSYTPFGEIRHVIYPEAEERVKSGAITTKEYLDIALGGTNRGFTGHEHIEGTELIHMNGRVYDPTIGRFLSADPFIQDPMNTQSYKSICEWR